MSTYILVPGAWLGAWAWRETAEALRARGHEVHALTLTGLAERAELGSTEVDLETHIGDVTGFIEDRDLHDVILVGHSYAGIVVGAVAHRIGERLSHIVYVDSAPMGDGQGMFDLLPPEAVEGLRALVAAGNGWGLPFPGQEALAENGSVEGLTPEHWKLLGELATPHPFGTYEQRLSLPGAPSGAPRKVLVACADFSGMLDAGNPWLNSLIDDSWLRRDLATGHWPMLSEPAALAEVLDRLAADR
ncbi:alpha/beta fold hydrolase [Phytomonospora sp. NPDC050363]|uniref:alpha/beta fold hydrolase n=1 Tax=Phytomonospora sp. NPDC050363 TaxID=3155642 RepID=UPI0033E2CFD2